MTVGNALCGIPSYRSRLRVPDGAERHGGTFPTTTVPLRETN